MVTELAATSEKLNWIEVQDYLYRRLKLSSPAVGVKVIGKNDEIPPEAESPAIMVDMCILSSLARFHDKVVVATADDVACKYGACNTGLIHYDESEIVDRYWNMLMKKSVEEENLARLFRQVPKLPEGTKGVLMAPIAKIPIEPDLVMIVGNSLHMTIMINSYVLESGIGRLHFSSAGSQGVCADSIAADILTEHPQVAFPCNGSRIFGLYDDNEVIFSVQTRNMRALLEGLRKTEAKMRVPVPKNLAEFRVGIVSDFLTKKRTPDTEKGEKKQKAGFGIYC